MLTHFKQDEIRLSNSNNDPLPVPHIINLTASCVNVSLEGVDAFDRTVAQETRHVCSLFSSDHTPLVRLHLIMSEPGKGTHFLLLKMHIYLIRLIIVQLSAINCFECEEEVFY